VKAKDEGHMGSGFGFRVSGLRGLGLSATGEGEMAQGSVDSSHASCPLGFRV
jgi:hypothetical protein